MLGLILAGGLGTRLRSIVSDRPKPMALIGDKPFLHYLMEYGVNQGISRFVLAVGYKNNYISDYFGKSFLGVPIEYSIETTPLGTGGAIIKALRGLNELTAVFNGDTYFPINLSNLIKFHEEKHSSWTMALFRTSNTDRYMGVACDSDHRITALRISGGKHQSILANAGTYLINSRVLSDLKYETCSLESSVLPLLLDKGIGVFGKEYNNNFIDIGIPEDYLKARFQIK